MRVLAGFRECDVLVLGIPGVHSQHFHRQTPVTHGILLGASLLTESSSIVPVEAFAVEMDPQAAKKIGSLGLMAIAGTAGAIGLFNNSLYNGDPPNSSNFVN